MHDEDAVLDAARRRAEALAARDADTLRSLMHPELRWTTHRGHVLTRDDYVQGNTDGSLRWHSQRLEDPDVVVTGDTAILTALVVDVVERQGQEQEFRMHLTQTWIRQAGSWVCLSGHAGPVV